MEHDGCDTPRHGQPRREHHLPLHFRVKLFALARLLAIRQSAPQSDEPAALFALHALFEDFLHELLVKKQAGDKNEVAVTPVGLEYVTKLHRESRCLLFRPPHCLHVVLLRALCDVSIIDLLRAARNSLQRLEQLDPATFSEWLHQCS